MFTVSTSIICLWVRFQYNFLKCCTLAFLIKFNDMVVLINEIQIMLSSLRIIIFRPKCKNLLSFTIFHFGPINLDFVNSVL